MQIRVFDKTRNRYGKILAIGFVTKKILYGIYDKEGDPVEISPTAIDFDQATIELDGQPVKSLSLLSGGKEVVSLSFFHAEVDLKTETIPLTTLEVNGMPATLEAI